MASTIKNIGFNTSVFTGTGSRETAGEGLAKIITAGATAYEQKLEIDRVYDAREEAELAKSEKMVLNSKYLEHDTQRNEFISSGNRSSAELEEFERGRQQDMADTFSGFSSDWSKTSSHTHIGSYDTAIKKHFASDLKLKTSNMYDEIKKSASLNPDITMEELNSSINFLNESSGITGDVYKTSGALVSYTKSAIVDAEKTNPLEFNEEEWRAKNKLLSEVEDPVLRGYADDVAKTMKSKKNGIITGINKTYTDGRLDEIFKAGTIAKRNLITKEILADEVNNPYVTNQTRKPLLAYIKALNSSDGSGKAHGESELKYAIKNAKKQLEMSSDTKSYDQTLTNMKFVRENGMKAVSYLSNSLDYTFGESSPQENLFRKNALMDAYSKAVKVTIEYDSHTAGKPIPSLYSDEAKGLLKQTHSKSFMNNMLSNPEVASKSLITLGKFPDDFNRAIDDAIVSGNTEQVTESILAVANMTKDDKANAIANRNPKVAALIKAHSNLRTLEKIVPALQELESDPDKKKEFGNTIKSYRNRINKESAYDNVSNATKNKMAERMAYENIFSLRSEEDAIKDADDILDSMNYEEEDARIFDVEGKYNSDDLGLIAKKFNEKVLPNITSPDADSSDRKVSMNINSDGGMLISYGSLVLARIENKKEVTSMINSFAALDKIENPPNPQWNNTKKHVSNIVKNANISGKISDASSSMINNLLEAPNAEWENIKLFIPDFIEEEANKYIEEELSGDYRDQYKNKGK